MGLTLFVPSWWDMTTKTGHGSKRNIKLQNRHWMKCRKSLLGDCSNIQGIVQVCDSPPDTTRKFLYFISPAKTVLLACRSSKGKRRYRERTHRQQYNTTMLCGRRHKLEAAVASPNQLCRWKISRLESCRIIIEEGLLTRSSDFRIRR